MAKITRVDGSQTRTLLPEMLMGRSSLCGLRLDNADVSKEHAVIRWTDSGWELRDLDSRNGTIGSHPSLFNADHGGQCQGSGDLTAVRSAHLTAEIGSSLGPAFRTSQTDAQIGPLDPR